MKNILYILIPILLIFGLFYLFRDEEMVLVDNYTFEINSDLKIKSLIVNKGKCKIANLNDKIDTTTLGSHEISIKYKLNGEDEIKKININIVDTTAPIIKYENYIKVKPNTKVSLYDNVKVEDNSKEKINPTIEGLYSVNDKGIYKLKYVASDSSGNTTKVDFTLEVGD